LSFLVLPSFFFSSPSYSFDNNNTTAAIEIKTTAEMTPNKKKGKDKEMAEENGMVNGQPSWFVSFFPDILVFL